MSLVAYLRKAALAGSLARGTKVTLGDKVYRMKGLFANAIALQNSARWDESEPWMDPTFRCVFRCREGAFLDVGANLGQTMFKVLALDPSRQYIGFEPQLGCSFMIQRFLEENHISNFTILPVGLSNTNQLIKLHCRGDYDGTASVIDGFRPDSFYTSHRYVCLRKGDDAVSELGLESICAIKVDVEGAELDVFEGLLNTIEKTMPFLIFEVLNHFLVVTGRELDDQTVRFRESRIGKMEKILKERDYEIFNIRGSGDQLENVCKIEPCVSDDLSLTNYIAIPKSGLDAFLRLFSDQVHDTSSARAVAGVSGATC